MTEKQVFLEKYNFYSYKVKVAKGRKLLSFGTLQVNFIKLPRETNQFKLNKDAINNMKWMKKQSKK